MDHLCDAPYDMLERLYSGDAKSAQRAAHLLATLMVSGVDETTRATRGLSDPSMQRQGCRARTPLVDARSDSAVRRMIDVDTSSFTDSVLEQWAHAQRRAYANLCRIHRAADGKRDFAPRVVAYAAATVAFGCAWVAAMGGANVSARALLEWERIDVQCACALAHTGDAQALPTPDLMSDADDSVPYGSYERIRARRVARYRANFVPTADALLRVFADATRRGVTTSEGEVSERRTFPEVVLMQMAARHCATTIAVGEAYVQLFDSRLAACVPSIGPYASLSAFPVPCDAQGSRCSGPSPRIEPLQLPGRLAVPATQTAVACGPSDIGAAEDDDDDDDDEEDDEDDEDNEGNEDNKDNEDEEHEAEQVAEEEEGARLKKKMKGAPKTEPKRESKREPTMVLPCATTTAREPGASWWARPRHRRGGE